MFTLSVWAVAIVWCLASFGVVLAWRARRAGSPHGRFWVGVGTVAGLMALGVGVALLDVAVSGPAGKAAPAVSVVLTVAQFWVAFRVLRAVFRLTTLQTWGLIGAYVVAAVVNFGLLHFVVRQKLVEAYVMPTANMGPTLDPGDRLSVDKRAEPRRWDLIAYRSKAPMMAWETERPIYCKRVVGLPGEKLRFENGTVFANDAPQAAPAVTAGRYTMALGAGGRPTPTRYNDGDTVQLGPDEYFVVGDQLEISADSRLDGPVVRPDVVGVVDLIYWPIGKVAVLR